MSLFIKRGLVFLSLSVALGLGSATIWPGDGGLRLGHWVGMAGFFLTALFAIVAAASLVVGVIGSAWKVDDFDVNEYLDEVK